MRKLATARTGLVEAAQTEGGLYRGRLAEAYDGIGQYVLVSLANSSVAAAYKARVAAGDFGGSRTFPRGTPVTVAAHRGNLEVFLGNLPHGCRCGDPFNRDETVGLGTGPLGTYTYPEGPITEFSVDGTAAHLDLSGLPHTVLPLDVNTQPSVPFEALFKMKAKSLSSPFKGWQGSGISGFDDFEFFVELDLPAGASVVSMFMGGTYPSSNMFFGVVDNRERASGGFGSDDFDDVEFSWPRDDPEISFWFRYYLDQYGVYARIWLDGTEEPIEYDWPTTVKPFYQLGYQPDIDLWDSLGGGKGQAWHAYEVNLSPKKEYIFSGFRFGSNGVNGTAPFAIIDEVCLIRGGWC